MTTQKRKKISYDKFNWDKLEKRNRLVRERFEKEAHYRERNSIMDTVNGYNDWISENALKQIMYNGTR